MNKYKICVYAICKNEEKFVSRWMESALEADYVVVLDTGSTDDTVDKLKDLGATVYEKQITPWRFDVARNISLDYVPDDTDICVCTDLDEIFEPGWREKLENLWEPRYTRANYNFAWSHNEDGSIKKQSIKTKIHRKQDFRWVHPVHEVLEYSGSDPDIHLNALSIVLHHYPDTTKSRGQYLPLLELSAKENPTDPQTIFWLGREYIFYSKNDECIDTLKRYINLPNANWAEEKCSAMRFIAKAYLNKGIEYEAKQWYFRAIGECMDIREAYIDFAKFAYRKCDWNLLYYLCDSALKINRSTNSYLSEVECWSGFFEDYASIACYWLGMYDKSKLYIDKAVSLRPDDERLINNLKIIYNKVGDK